MNVLIVDDFEPMRLLIRKKIESRHKAHFFEATSGNEAISLIEKNAFDLIICDQHMRDGSGIDVVRFLEENPERKTHIIIFSSDDDFISKLRKEARCSAVLKSDLEALLATVEKLGFVRS